jgi:hypothetical protein
MHLSWRNAFRAAAALEIVSFAACDKPTADQGPPDAELPVVAQSTPVATPVATPAVATPEPNYFAPPGVYYLLGAVSVETPDGIVGLTPGARLLKIAPGKYAAGGHQLELRDSQVTNDMRIAQRVAGADQAAQAALRQARQSVANAPRANAPTAPSPTPSTIVAVGQPSRSTVPRPGLGSSLGSSGALGKTRSQDGWIWQLDGNGDWQPLRREK